MAPPLLALQDIHLSFGGTSLLEGAELSVFERDRLCVVGRNGSGKSTLLKIAAGLIEPDKGERFLQPGTTVQYLEQEPDLSDFNSVQAYAATGLGSDEEPYRVGYLLNELGLTGMETPAELSGGEARRAAIARALAPQPDILLLDEPTNHLDLPAIEWMERELSGTKSAVILISHDRRFLEALSRRTVWIDRCRTRAMEHGFERFEAWRDETLEQEERDRHKLDRKIVRENHWLVHGVTGRRKRNQKRLANLHELRAERQNLAESSRRATETVNMAAVQAEASGKLVIEARRISKAWAEAPIVRDFSMKVQRQDRIGIVGPNGAGKTTLVKLLTGELAPDSGEIRHGTKLELVSLDQKRENLQATEILQDALTGGGRDMVMVGDRQRHVVSYMKDFLFEPEQARTPIEALSGGERGRLMLARAFAKPSNILVLDEPTNDLDLETLDLLQELLADYAGTVLLVSHDRDFLDRVTTLIVASNGNGTWTSYAGGYSDMLVQRALGAAAATKPSKQHEGGKRAGGAGAERAARDRTVSRPVSTPSPKRKLSFKEKHALETLPDQMQALESKIANLKGRLADPEFYDRDLAAFKETADALVEAQAEMATSEEEWLRLEILREELEGG